MIARHLTLIRFPLPRIPYSQGQRPAEETTTHVPSFEQLSRIHAEDDLELMVMEAFATSFFPSPAPPFILSGCLGPDGHNLPAQVGCNRDQHKKIDRADRARHLVAADVEDCGADHHDG